MPRNALRSIGGFTVGTAMSRNKLIYALSRTTLVVCAEEDKGGTWSGAIEALQKQITTVAVWMGPGAGSGNAKLARRGAVEVQDVSGVLDVATPRRSTVGEEQMHLEL